MEDKEAEGDSSRRVVLALLASEKAAGKRPEKQQGKLMESTMLGKGTNVDAIKGELRKPKPATVGDRASGNSNAKVKGVAAVEDRGKQGFGDQKAGGVPRDGKGKEVAQHNLGKSRVESKATAGGSGSMTMPRVVLKVRSETLKKDTREGKGIGEGREVVGPKESKKEGKMGYARTGGKKEGQAGDGPTKEGGSVGSGASQPVVIAAAGGGSKESEKHGDTEISVSLSSGKHIAFRMTAPSEEEMGDRKRSAEIVEDLAKDPTPVKKLCLDDPM
ncbi:unnamed protein product [Linum trigynum]